MLGSDRVAKVMAVAGGGKDSWENGVGLPLAAVEV